jgi:hypothetical protein
MWGNNNVVPLYVMKNQTITLHQNSKEQNLSPQNIWGNNNVGCIPLYMVKNQTKTLYCNPTLH